MKYYPLKIALYLFFIHAFLACSSKSNSKKTTEKIAAKPNIIVILLDDAGYADFGFMGSEDLETPHIDELAQSGVIFTDAHVSATVCAPSRAGLLTGIYQQRFGFEANHTGDQYTGDIGLSDHVLTLADALKTNKYNTVAIGKWHLGATQSDHPNQRGFDDFYGFLAGGRSYFPLKNPNKKKMLQHNGRKVNFEGYLTDVLGDYATSYIEQHQKKPFFMYLSFNAVHTPMEAKETDLEKFKNHPRQRLAAMTWSLDENIGKIRAKLAQLQQLDNSLIFFLSDNGGAVNNESTNTPLKGWKGNKYEGGHRVPFILSWPKEISPKKHFDGLTSSLDIFSTAMDASKNETFDTQHLDGVSLLPYLKAEKKGNPHNALFWRKLDESAARMDAFKLIRLKGYGNRLYNLHNDIGETKDLSQTLDSVNKNMSTQLFDWEQQLMKPQWKEEKEWMDVTEHIHKSLMNNKKPQYTQPTKKRSKI